MHSSSICIIFPTSLIRSLIIAEEMAQDALYYEETVGDSDYGYAAAEDEEETPVWKQGGGMRTLAIDSRATSAYAPSLSPSTWEVGKPTSTAPHSIVRDTNAKLSLAPHSPMVLAVQKTPVGNNRSHHVSTTQRTADYVHTPVKSDDHELIMGYGIHDMSNKHLFRDGRSELMSPPVKVRVCVTARNPTYH